MQDLNQSANGLKSFSLYNIAFTVPGMPYEAATSLRRWKGGILIIRTAVTTLAIFTHNRL